MKYYHMKNHKKYMNYYRMKNHEKLYETLSHEKSYEKSPEILYAK